MFICVDFCTSFLGVFFPPSWGWGVCAWKYLCINITKYDNNNNFNESISLYCIYSNNHSICWYQNNTVYSYALCLCYFLCLSHSCDKMSSPSHGLVFNLTEQIKYIFLQWVRVLCLNWRMVSPPPWIGHEQYKSHVKAVWQIVVLFNRKEPNRGCGIWYRYFKFHCGAGTWKLE